MLNILGIKTVKRMVKPMTNYRAVIEELTKRYDTLSDRVDVLYCACNDLLKFAQFVAEEVVVDGDEWAYNQMSFPELACRKLYKLGIVGEKDGRWTYERKES